MFPRTLTQPHNESVATSSAARSASARLRRTVGGLTRREFRSPRRIRLDYPRAAIELTIRTRREMLTRARPCFKEPWTVAWLERELRPSDVLWDVGANVGGYSLIAASIGSGARVVAVEPSYSSYSALCENIVLNNLAAFIHPVPIALSRTTGLDSFSYSDVAAGAASHALASIGPAPSDSLFAAAYQQVILTYSLDDLLAGFSLPAPTLMKLDVDGAEGAVLAGASSTIANSSLRSILIEMERENASRVQATLHEAGFQLTQRVDERYGSPLKYHWYGIFDRPTTTRP